MTLRMLIPAVLLALAACGKDDVRAADDCRSRHPMGLPSEASPAETRRMGPPMMRQDGDKPWETMKQRRQDEMGGVPAAVLARQAAGKVAMPSIDDAIILALKAADEAARPLIDREFHAKGRTIRVPADHAAIQAAIDAANSGDTVLVAAGTYFELLVAKDGVKLVSDAGDGGDEAVAVKGARLKLPRRALRTIVDGSKSKASSHGMVDFEPGAGRRTIVDGFTFQNLPQQDHHQPGHAHGLNVRGASPVILNCLIRNNGSTGIGNHVVYKDAQTPMDQRDLRRANIQHEASAVIYRNIIHGSFGLGIGCNHFSTPFILGNEVFGNDDSELGETTPGIGCKHGAGPVIVGNVVHDNVGGGILGKAGERQGKFPIDGPTHPRAEANVVFDNGADWPAIACDGAGSEKEPVWFVGNYIYRAGLTGVALANGSVGIVEGNHVSGSGAPGIAIENSIALRLNRNEVTGAKGPGFAIVNQSVVREMAANVSDGNSGPRFVLRGGTIESKE